MAHAIHGYSGACKNIHGHSYELFVTVACINDSNNFIPDPGFVIDFKELEKLTISSVIKQFDHKLVLSRNFLSINSSLFTLENLVILEFEPSVENLLIHIKNIIHENLPETLKIIKLKLHETKNSYAEWINI